MFWYPRDGAPELKRVGEYLELGFRYKVSSFKFKHDFPTYSVFITHTHILASPNSHDAHTYTFTVKFDQNVA